MSSLASWVILASSILGQAEDQSHRDHLKAFAADFLGEWVSESEAEFDLPGIWEKGDKIVAYLNYEWICDGGLIGVDWWAEVNGKLSPGKAKAIIGWDSSKNLLSGSWYSTAGERGEFAYVKSGDTWLMRTSSALAGGVRACAVMDVTFADGGKTMTNKVTHRIRDGESLADEERTWKRK
jgi:hypothetical protein